MTSSSTSNLDQFEESYRRVNKLYLMPAFLNSDSSYPEFVGKAFIIKNKVIFKWAWEIEENDEDIAALRPDDNPVIPSNISNPPILEILDKIKNKKL